MTIPPFIKLFSQIWSIRAAQPHEIGDDLGQCKCETHEIILSPAQTQQQMYQTLMHEIVHAFETTLHLDLSENQVDLLALCFIHFIRENPGFIDLYNPVEVEEVDDAQ
jgi:hypothetical protein